MTGHQRTPLPNLPRGRTPCFRPTGNGGGSDRPSVPSAGVRAVLVSSLLLGVAGLGAAGSLAAERAPPDASDYARRLDRPCGVFWTDVPLRQGLSRLGEVQGVPIFLDRRVDPDQRLTLSLDAPSLRHALEALAEKLALGVSYFEPIVYLGPPAAASRLRTLAALRRDEFPPQDRRRNLRKPPAWPALSAPREILRDLCVEAGLSLKNLEEIPHDLWPEVRLPAMPWTDRMTLVLIGFDRTFQVDPTSNSVAFVPITGEPTLTRRLPLPEGLSSGDILAQRWQQFVPDVRAEIAGNEMIAEGPLESLERLADILRGDRTKPSRVTSAVTSMPALPSGSAPSTVEVSDPFASRRFTVRQGQGTLGGVIRQLAAQLQMNAQIDIPALASRGIHLDRKITFTVNDGTVDDLWRAVLEPQGLRFERRGREIRVFPANP